MNKFLIAICTIVCAFLFVDTVSAQDNGAGKNSDFSIGLRLTPDGGGFTAKYFFKKDLAVEAQLNAGGLFAFSGESFNAVGLVQYHIELADPAWRLFFGGGAHVGVWERGTASDFLFGFDAIGGVEYQFKNFPLAVSADFKPAVNLSPSIDFFPHNCIGVAGRFYLGR